MKWRDIVHFWITGEDPDERKDRERITMLLNEQYRLANEAFQSETAGNKETAREKRDAAERIARRIGRIEAGTEDIGI